MYISSSSHFPPSQLDLVPGQKVADLVLGNCFSTKSGVSHSKDGWLLIFLQYLWNDLLVFLTVEWVSKEEKDDNQCYDQGMKKQNHTTRIFKSGAVGHSPSFFLSHTGNSPFLHSQGYLSRSKSLIQCHLEFLLLYESQCKPKFHLDLLSKEVHRFS